MKYVFLGCSKDKIEELLKHLGHLEHTIRDDILTFLNVSEDDIKYIDRKSSKHCGCQELTECYIRLKLPN